MPHMRKQLALFLMWYSVLAPLRAEDSVVEVEKPKGRLLIRSYQAATVPPVRLKDSERLRQLVRAGKLYLTVQDALAAAIENNLDLETDRYGPLAAEWQLERQQSGGPLRGVTGGNTLANQNASGLGVAGALSAAGLSNSGGGGSSGNTGGATISQIGPITPNLDPVLQQTSAYLHLTYPQAITALSQTPTLVNTEHIYDTSVTQGLLTGGFLQVSANEEYLKQNAPSDVLNPAVAPAVQIYAQHDFLRNFGVGVNSRFIRVAEKNIVTSQETFRSQLLNLVASVLNLYWDLVGDNEELKARRRTLDVAQKFYNDTKRQIELSALAKVDIFRARAELTTRQQEVAIAQAAVRQQENVLKDALSHDGSQDAVVDAAEIVPLDSIQVPEQDELPPLRQLVARALAKRPDVELGKINQENLEILAAGTASGVLPLLRGIGSLTDAGLSGTSSPPPGGSPADPYYVGGLGNALGQISRHDFPSWQTELFFQGRLQNRIAQGDYGVDQLQLRQNELITRRSLNQLVVDISNQVTALRQARARYTTAIDARTLQEQLLEKEQQKFSGGVSTINDVVTVQRSLGAARVAEVTALTTYSRARVSLDQVLGETLEKNNVSVSRALEERTR
jgi:outer membrane protein